MKIILLIMLSAIVFSFSLIESWHFKANAPVVSLTFSDDGILGVASWDRCVYFFNQDGSVIRELCVGSAINDISYCCGKFGFVTMTGYAYITDNYGNLLKEFNVGYYYEAITLLPDGFIVCASWCALFDFYGNKEWVTPVGYVLNGPAVVNGYVYAPGAYLFIIRLSDGERVKSIDVGDTFIDTAVCGNKLAALASHHLYLYDLSDPLNPVEIWSTDEIVYGSQVAFSPGCNYIAVADDGGHELKVFNSSGTLVFEKKYDIYGDLDDRVLSVAWWGDKLAVGLYGGDLYVYEVIPDLSYKRTLSIFDILKTTSVTVANYFNSIMTASETLISPPITIYADQVTNTVTLTVEVNPSEIGKYSKTFNYPIVYKGVTVTAPITVLYTVAMGAKTSTSAMITSPTTFFFPVSALVNSAITATRGFSSGAFTITADEIANTATISVIARPSEVGLYTLNANYPVVVDTATISIPLTVTINVTVPVNVKMKTSLKVPYGFNVTIGLTCENNANNVVTIALTGYRLTPIQRSVTLTPFETKEIPLIINVKEKNSKASLKVEALSGGIKDLKTLNVNVTSIIGNLTYDVITLLNVNARSLFMPKKDRVVLLNESGFSIISWPYGNRVKEVRLGNVSCYALDKDRMLILRGNAMLIYNYDGELVDEVEIPYYLLYFTGNVTTCDYKYGEVALGTEKGFVLFYDGEWRYRQLPKVGAIKTIAITSKDNALVSLDETLYDVSPSSVVEVREGVEEVASCYNATAVLYANETLIFDGLTFNGVTSFKLEPNCGLVIYKKNLFVVYPAFSGFIDADDFAANGTRVAFLRGNTLFLGYVTGVVYPITSTITKNTIIVTTTVATTTKVTMTSTVVVITTKQPVYFLTLLALAIVAIRRISRT